MSVTLKLSDGDAKLAAQLLADVAKYGDLVLHDKDTVPVLKQIERTLASYDRCKQAAEVAAAFSVSARSNSPR